MKTKLIHIGLILISTFISSCDYERIRARGEVTSREFNFSGYTSLKVSDAFNVYVQFSDTEESIVIEANENLQDRIRIDMEGNTLDIRIKDRTSMKGDATLNMYIATKSITEFNITGASKLTLESALVAADADIRLSGASEFEGELNVGRLELDAKGASDIDIFGKVDRLDSSLSGASKLTNYDLAVEILDIHLKGASDAFLSVSKTIDIEASGASKLNYKGEAVIRGIKLSGASEIIKR